MAASRWPTASTCRAPSAGSPACTRSAWTWARSTSTRPWPAARRWASALKRVKEQLRAIPGRGLGYGLLRYLDPEAGPRLAGRPEPQLGFNYLGRFAAGADGDWTPAGEEAGLGGGADPAMPLAHLVEVNARTVDGPEGPRLTATWTWAGGAAR